MPSLTLPPFPSDIPTHPLLVVDYELIKAGDEEEINTLWQAATKLGFWYLKNHGVEENANQMFEMGAETMALPLDEKMRFEQGDDGISFGYKAAGVNGVDETGVPDTVEFINIAKDDALAWPTVARREYPTTVNARMEGTVTPFVRKSLDVNLNLMRVLNDRLGLPKGTLDKVHADEHSGSEARCIKRPGSSGPAEGKAIGAHTDFGSLSFLHNRLGGLQVLVPGTNDWQYIKPLPGHAICNVGDALSIFSSGILRSNMHRVVPPPGKQGQYDRWSLVFFSRPGNSVVLRPLIEDSTLIADAFKAKSPEDQQTFQTGSTSLHWFTRRIRNQRLKNRTGPETWAASRGTEHKPLGV